MCRVRWGYLLLIFLILAVFLYPLPVLEVRDDKAGEVMIRRKVSSGDTFEFRYIHSVDKTPVTGRFSITPENRIKPIETRFLSYGPGLPSIEGKVLPGTGEIVAKAEVKEMRQFSFFVSPMTHPSLILKGEKFDFSSIKEGSVIRIEVRKYPIGRMVIPYGRSGH